ncbi:MAG: peptidoglycan bridge formation glycyltransferase FemA/FemB family protein [Erysipelotrichaceae bacterium]|nr:peptidoglycan bridge formation glycyltransferase FemA/FemB family protein [Erysipelotrichaceae bacterium]MDP3306576.1 peptidoglycan bridge formation glycyltransferase FemA/FemB family protein [Erysipelotrichaceae bacterium]
MSIVFRNDPDIALYDSFVKNHPDSSMYQMSGWSTVKKEWECLRIIGESDGNIVCAVQILIRTFPFGKKLFYIPRGPLMADKRFSKEFFAYIKEMAKKQGAFCVKFDPNQVYQQLDSKGNVLLQHSELIDFYLECDKKMFHKGFDKAMGAYAQPRYNAVAQLSDTMDENFTNSAKRNIKIAVKKNVRVEIFSRDKLDSFAYLMELTEQRKGISLRNREYFQRFFDAFDSQVILFMASIDFVSSIQVCQQSIEELQGALAIAKKETNRVIEQRVQLENFIKEKDFFIEKQIKYGDEADVGGLLVLFHKDTAEYVYSGMNIEFSKYEPGYLVWSKAMEYSRSVGCEFVNFGGVNGELDDRLWEFKRSLGSFVYEYVGEFDLVIQPLVYTLFESGLPLAKKVVRKLKRLNK